MPAKRAPSARGHQREVTLTEAVLVLPAASRAVTVRVCAPLEPFLVFQL
jgi:hypothetical protein